jgi:bifunctional non-homologous end joining protein LigD
MKHLYKPMLASVADTPFSSEGWIFEVKWDGIRAISYVESDGQLSIRSRNNLELRQNFPEFQELSTLTRGTVLDGEIIVMNGGKADFQKLIERSKTASEKAIEKMATQFPATYIVFDILEKDGKTLIDLPLLERKRILGQSLTESRNVIISIYVEGMGETYYVEAVKKGVEGIMAKKGDSPYEPGRRSANWLKIKKLLTCDCVIFGYTKGGGSRAATFGALILGLFEDGKPTYVGKVGTGFTEDSARELVKQFVPLSGSQGLEGVDLSEGVTWVKPEIVCEVVYQAVTNDGKLRMPRFKGIRIDKKPLECTTNQLGSGLKEYREKRDFASTPEPSGSAGERSPQAETKGGIGEGHGPVYVVQEHHARRLHYDLRLERGGVLKSWAVPKGLPLEVGERRLAVETEDHPLDYGGFEGEIPKGEYGAGKVIIWDKGVYRPIVWGDDMIEFVVNGERVKGRYVLTRFKKAGEKQWLLFRARDKLE